MGILGYISDLLRKVIENIKSVRKAIVPIKEKTVLEQIEPYYSDYEAFQKDYNISQMRAPREKFKVFDTMVNRYIDEYDMSYTEAVEEVRYMLKTDTIDLEEGYQDFMEDRYNI